LSEICGECVTVDALNRGVGAGENAPHQYHARTDAEALGLSALLRRLSCAFQNCQPELIFPQMPNWHMRLKAAFSLDAVSQLA
jgi:hypothetical protein